MRFDLLHTSSNAPLRKALEYLQQANTARIEHLKAAEHHAALAAMYAQRATWFECEIANSAMGGMTSLRGMPVKPLDGACRETESVQASARLQRSDVESAA